MIIGFEALVRWRHPQRGSARQFQRDGFVETVDMILRGTGPPASCLELEITESVIVERSEQVIARFAALDAMGVRVSIDDFGTGYSSLSDLKRFAIHQLKIDQSFVRDISSDPDDAAIVSAIIAISHSLGLKVVWRKRSRPLSSLPSSDRSAAIARRVITSAGRCRRMNSRACWTAGICGCALRSAPDARE